MMALLLVCYFSSVFGKVNWDSHRVRKNHLLNEYSIQMISNIDAKNEDWKQSPRHTCTSVTWSGEVTSAWMTATKEARQHGLLKWRGADIKDRHTSTDLKYYREHKHSMNGDWQAIYTGKNTVNTCTEWRETKAAYQMLKEKEVKEMKKTHAGDCVVTKTLKFERGKANREQCKEGTEELGRISVKKVDWGKFTWWNKKPV